MATRVKVVVTLALSLTCLSTGAVFMYRAEVGDRACVDLIGSIELAEGAEPKYVCSPQHLRRRE